MRRVVITGLGGITPLGGSVAELWENIKKGVCGIEEIQNFDTTDFTVKLAAEVKNYDPLNYFDKKFIRRTDKVNQFAIIAAREAYKDSGLEGQLDSKRVGVYVSSGIGGLESLENEHSKGLKRHMEKISPFFIPMAISNLSASYIAIEFGFHSNVFCPVSACSGANTAIGEAFRSIKHGYNDVVFAGGAEASITPLGIGGFTAMKALSFSQDKNRASIPFDLERDGFVMGEGGAILVLEELEHAKNRGAKIYAEVVGYGSTCDAGHITAPNEEGKFASMAMDLSMEEANIRSSEVDYINAHGTSTPLNDRFETLAIKKSFDQHSKLLLISSTKSMTGHLLGASGGIEGIITTLALKESVVPATIGYRVSDPLCDLDIVANKSRKKELNIAISNSLGFGGHNVSICFKRWDS